MSNTIAPRAALLHAAPDRAAVLHAAPDEPAAPAACPRPIRIAIAGYGIVGQALAERLASADGFEIVAILVRDAGAPRRVAPPCPLTTDRRDLFAAAPDILIDLLSCAETGALLSELALLRGIHLVSASKRVIAGCLPTLADCASGRGARILYAAAVGGETPILETVAEAAAGPGIAAVGAVLNGTVNFILDQLSRGDSFDKARAAARVAGFAEEDPSEDLSGADALAKLKIIAATAFGGAPRDYDFAAAPLDDAAVARIQASGERWVQHARLARVGDRIEGGVTLQPRSAVGALPPVDREWNCALVTTRDGFSRVCFGRGAGGTATAGAILSDLSILARENFA